MKTECTTERLRFQVGRRELIAEFNGGHISSDAGSLLLNLVDKRLNLIEQFSSCFSDYRRPDRIEHTLVHLLRQRVFGIALGYEDLNDHDQLRHDPLLAAAVGHPDPLGDQREQAADRGKALAGKSTLNRLELTPTDAKQIDGYKKIVADPDQIDRLFVELFIQSHKTAPNQIILDFDATDDPIHGDQMGKFFHGYYRCYCYLPLYVFCGDHLLCAKLRPSNIDDSAGSQEVLEKLVTQIRQAWPEVQFIVRGDSGFCREDLMRWCEEHQVDYVLGLAKNYRLLSLIDSELNQAKEQFEQTLQACRVYKDFSYTTLKSWSCQRRVVGKAEHLSKGANPRFIVTSLSEEQSPAQTLYEKLYCARGEMENRIKEQQLYLFADRTSTHTMQANQLRLYFSSLAYTLLQGLRRLALQKTALANAQCSTLRQKLMKIGAQIRITVRKIWVAFSEAYPYQPLFIKAYRQLMTAGP